MQGYRARGSILDRPSQAAHLSRKLGRKSPACGHAEEGNQLGGTLGPIAGPRRLSSILTATYFDQFRMFPCELLDCCFDKALYPG